MTAGTLAANWTDGSAIGYPVLFGGVLLGSVVPVVPTGAVVGAGAAFAMTAHGLNLPLVLVVATLAAWTGDVITFAVCRFGGPSAVRWVARGQHADRIEEVREQFRKHGWQIIVIGRLLPAGRIPVLLAAGALAYPWRRLLPASLLAAFLWAVAYAVLGVVSGGIFDSPLTAVLAATVLVLVAGAVLNLLGSRRRRAPGQEDEAPAADGEDSWDDADDEVGEGGPLAGSRRIPEPRRPHENDPDPSPCGPA
jgi:membrane protein DedA with SNARE-associated domain